MLLLFIIVICYLKRAINNLFRFDFNSKVFVTASFLFIRKHEPLLQQQH